MRAPAGWWRADQCTPGRMLRGGGGNVAAQPIHFSPGITYAPVSLMWRGEARAIRSMTTAVPPVFFAPSMLSVRAWPTPAAGTHMVETFSVGPNGPRADEPQALASAAAREATMSRPVGRTGLDMAVTTICLASDGLPFVPHILRPLRSGPRQRPRRPEAPTDSRRCAGTAPAGTSPCTAAGAARWPQRST